MKKTPALIGLLALSLSLLPIGASTVPAHATAGTGNLTIISSGTESGWEIVPASGSSPAVLRTTGSGAATIKASHIITALNSGDLVVQGALIAVQQDIVATSGNYSLTFKALVHIAVSANIDIATRGGNAIFWADSDASGDTSTAGGYVAFLAGSSLQTAGGNIVIAGGLDDGLNGGVSGDGIPDGYIFGAKATGIDPAGGGFSGTAAVFLNSATLDAGSGSVLIRGNGTGAFANFQMGVWLQVGSITANQIDIFAKGSFGGASSSNWGLMLSGFTLTSPGNISLFGWGGKAGATNTDTNQIGIYLISSGSTPSTIQTTGSGNISLDGVGGGGTFCQTPCPASPPHNALGIYVRADQVITSAAGNITFTGESGLKGSSALAIVSLSSPTTTSGNISFVGLNNTQGTLNPASGGVTLAGASASAGTLSIESTGDVTQTAAITASNLALTGSGAVTLTHAGNNFGTISAGTSVSKVARVSVFDASGGLTVGQVGSLQGVSSTGDVLIETGAGDISVAGSVATDSTSNTAITFNAGKSTAVGTRTGGNIVVSGTPTLTTGTGGIVRMFSGIEAASTGLTNLVGGLANVKYNVDETSTFSPALSSGAKYALYRSAITTPQLSPLANLTKTVGDSVLDLTPPSATDQSNNSVAGSTSWSSSNSSVASLTGSSLSFGSAGTATITATFTPTDSSSYDIATASFTVTVSAAPSSSTPVSSTPASASPKVISLVATGASQGVMGIIAFGFALIGASLLVWSRRVRLGISSSRPD
jgi:hypothetical protein